MGLSLGKVLPSNMQPTVYRSAVSVRLGIPLGQRQSYDVLNASECTFEV